MEPEYEKVFQFVIELEKLKAVCRKVKAVGQDRYENAAEHSWQVAMLALSLIPYSKDEIDSSRVLQMLLVHDVVEIDTSDKIVYSEAHEDTENEEEAAERIFGLLPEPTATEFLDLWREFEKNESLEAKFAKGVDRLMPVLQNLYNDGQSWVENGIRLEQVLSMNTAVADVSPELWKMVKGRIRETVSRGYLR